MPSQIFTMDDTGLYASWEDNNDAAYVCLFIPGIGQVKMTLAKAEEVSDSIARQAEYGRWAVMEKKQELNN